MSDITRQAVSTVARTIVRELWAERERYAIDRNTEPEQFQHILSYVQASMSFDLSAVVYEEFRAILDERDEEQGSETEMQAAEPDEPERPDEPLTSVPGEDRPAESLLPPEPESH